MEIDENIAVLEEGAMFIHQSIKQTMVMNMNLWIDENIAVLQEGAIPLFLPNGDVFINFHRFMFITIVCLMDWEENIAPS